jgi:hypothetical protein
MILFSKNREATHKNNMSLLYFLKTDRGKEKSKHFAQFLFWSDLGG